MEIRLCSPGSVLSFDARYRSQRSTTELQQEMIISANNVQIINEGCKVSRRQTIQSLNYNPDNSIGCNNIVHLHRLTDN